jgi:XTP/dITP diphosphohydrolase
MRFELRSQLLLATNNAGKVHELKQLLSDLSKISILTPLDMGLTLHVEETGSTYAENAGLKAKRFQEASGMIALADDSGLEVDALHGAPGVRSARYSAKPGATDADRRSYLLDNLAGLPRPWTARFMAWVAVAVPGQELKLWQGTCEGEIIPDERGTNGFGYDPIFYIPSVDSTMAELADEKKNLVSHRGNAVRSALPWLMDAFTE